MLPDALSCILPLLFAGAIHHGLVIPRGWLASWAMPVDGGARFRGQPLFGPAKTYRGFAVVIVLSAISAALLTPLLGGRFHGAPFLAGAILGCAYACAELPTSFLKRRMNANASQEVPGRWRLPFRILDQMDSVLGATVAAAFLLREPTAGTLAFLVLLGTGLHLGIDVLLHRVGYKRAISRTAATALPPQGER